MFHEKFYDFIENVMQSSLSIAIFTIYMWLGNTLTINKVIITELMLQRIKGEAPILGQMMEYFNRLLLTMAELQEFYQAPEVQKGIICRKEQDQDSDLAISIKGNFSHGIKSKVDQAERSKVLAQRKKEDYEKRTQGMGRIRKKIFDLWPSTTVETPQIPL